VDAQGEKPGITLEQAIRILEALNVHLRITVEIGGSAERPGNEAIPA
jgi:hypothetical protein